MIVQVEAGDWTGLGAEAKRIRTMVFVQEQGIPAELEYDEADARCVHVVARDENGQAVGTGRLLPDGHVGRLSVLASARRGGVGRAMMVRLLNEARERGYDRVMINAQVGARSFYQQLGFTETGSEFMEAGIPHVVMSKKLADGR